MSDANTTIDGFELLNCIATGNFSQVWEVKEISSTQSFAMKLLLEEAFAESEFKAQLKHEANVGRSVEHPNLITVFDTRVTKRLAYFTMELFHGLNLKTMIRAELTDVHVRAKKIIECSAQALGAMHEKGWVHKDIKPENILATRGSEVRVIDFSLATRAAGGLSKMLGSNKRRIIQGTRSYIAPELIRKEPTTPQVDMYSLGITLYEMLIGRPPFVIGNPNELLMAHIQERPEPPSSYNENISPEVDQLVLRMLAKQPKNRPSNMQELLAETRSIQFFKADPEEYNRAQAEAAIDKFKDSMAHRIDSRTDAEQSPEERKAAAVAAQKKAARVARTRARVASANKETQEPAPAPPGPPQPGPPQPAPPPPMMPAGFPVPPGYPMPPQAYPQPPGFPGAYPTPAPGMPYPMAAPPPGAPPQVPGMPPAPGAPPVAPQAGQPVQQPAPQPPVAEPQPPEGPSTPAEQGSTAGATTEKSAPARPIRPRRKSTAAPDEAGADLPVMDELPDVM